MPSLGALSSPARVTSPGLTGQDLDALPGKPIFWRDFGAPSLRPQPLQGYCLQQSKQETLCGIGVDRDTVLQENVLFGLANEDVNVEAPDPAPTERAIPVPFDPTSVWPPPVSDQ
jgi:hypothetical protein